MIGKIYWLIEWLTYCRELVKLLHDRGTAVYLVSGGFKSIIERAAEQLNIPNENIFANRLLFDDEGNLNLYLTVVLVLQILIRQIVYKLENLMVLL